MDSGVCCCMVVDALAADTLLMYEVLVVQLATCHGNQRRKRSYHSTKFAEEDFLTAALMLDTVDHDKNEAIIMISVTNVY